MTRTNEQKRAAFALEFVRAEQGRTARDKMLTHIHNTPMQVLQNGLGQALAFLLADNEGKSGQDTKPSGRLYGKLQDWLSGIEQNDTRPCRVFHSEKPDLIKQLMEGNREQYIRAEREAVVVLNWVKKFAEAWLA